MFDWFTGYEAKRKRQLRSAPEGPVRDFLSVPFPDKGRKICDIPMLAVDFETTGLHAKNDKLLSVGFVDLRHGQIPLKSSYHQIIRSKGRLKADNVSIHQITDSQKDAGESLALVVEELLKALAGKVMLVHFARIEKQFLSQACLELYGMAPIFPMIDTLVCEKRLLDMRDVAYDPSELRLANIRHKYQLPQHFAHNALNDAVATAELLMAHIAHLPQGDQTPLKSLLL